MAFKQQVEENSSSSLLLASLQASLSVQAQNGKGSWTAKPYAKDNSFYFLWYAKICIHTYMQHLVGSA